MTKVMTSYDAAEAGQLIPSLRASSCGSSLGALPLEHFANFLSECFRGERFVQERDPGLEDPVLDDGVLGVPGHVDHS